jgi:superkiller protein 3
MSSVKSLLKAVGEAIKQKKWDEAAQQARDVLAKDGKNYQG